jgi:ABC-2 type transport system ATP-binding protein
MTRYVYDVSLCDIHCPVIEARALTKHFGDTVALDGFELVVEAGEIAGLVGHNGAGKTTFARAAAGLVALDRGSIVIAGFDAASAPREARARLGLAPQELAIYPTASPRENLALFAGLHGLSRAEARRATQRVARDLCLEDVLDRRLGTLSGGQQRRVQAATAMIHRPAVLLLDEPTVGADPVTRASLLAAVRSAADDGAAVVYTTHYLPELDVLGATLAIADHGTVVARGARHELLAGADAETLDDLYHEVLRAP